MKLKTFGDWRKLFPALSCVNGSRVATASFFGALQDLNRSLPCINDRKQNSPLTDKEIGEIEELLRIGIILGVLPIKMPDTWGEYLSITDKAGTKLNRERRGPKADFAEHLEGVMKFTLSRMARVNLITRHPDRKKRLHEVNEVLPVLVEEALRDLTFRGYFDPMQIIDFENIYKP